MNIFKSLDIRLVALLLAAILWLHAATEREYTVAFNCPVEVVNIPPDLVVSSRLTPASCSITAKGKDLLALKFKGPRVVVDAGHRRIKSLTAKLAESPLVLPFGLEPVHVEFQPTELSIKLDRLADKSVLVFPDLAGQPAEGFIISDSTAAEPCSVRLWGPERLVLQMDTVFTEPVRIDELRETQRRRVRLALPDTMIYRTEPESVWVNLFFEKTGEKLFRNIPLTLANRGSGYLVSFSPGTVDVVISGPKQLLEEAKATDIKVFLDLKGLAPGSHQLQAVIELPDKLELMAAAPRTFEVTIR
jgi:YbbR domain-containing protein